MNLIGSGDIIKKSFSLYKQHWNFLYKYLLLLLAVMLGSIFFASLVLGAGVLLFATQNIPVIILAALVLFCLLLVIIAMSLIVNFGMLQSIEKMYTGQPLPTIAESLRAAKAVIWKGFGTSLLAGLYAVWPLFVVLSGYAIFTFVTLGLLTSDGPRPTLVL